MNDLAHQFKTTATTRLLDGLAFKYLEVRKLCTELDTDADRDQALMLITDIETDIRQVVATASPHGEDVNNLAATVMSHIVCSLFTGFNKGSDFGDCLPKDI